MSEKSTLDMIQEIVRVKINITLAGAIELSAFPLEAIREVLLHFKPHPSRSSYSVFKRQLNTYCSSNGIKPSWKEMFQLRDAMGIGEYAAKEESPKGSSQSPSTGYKDSGKQTSGFVTLEDRPDGSKIIKTPDGQKIILRGNRYRTTNYPELYDDFEQRRIEGKENMNMTNPFEGRAKGQADLHRDEYEQHQLDERESIVREREERGKTDRAHQRQNALKLQSLSVGLSEALSTRPMSPQRNEMITLAKNTLSELTEQQLEDKAMNAESVIEYQQITTALRDKRNKSVSDNANSAYFKAIAVTATPLVEVPLPFDDDGQWEEVFDI